MTATRQAGPEDIEAILFIVNTAYTLAEAHFTDELRTDLAEVTEAVAAGRFIVLEHEGRIAGAVHVESQPPHGHFGMLAVEPSLQNRGLGRILVAAAESRCREHGCSEIHLEAVNAREPLPPWYERLGYTEYGRAPYVRPPEACKIPVEFVLMSKRLEAEGGQGRT